MGCERLSGEIGGDAVEEEEVETRSGEVGAEWLGQM